MMLHFTFCSLLSSIGACRQMCVVKVNRVESNSVRHSNKELLHNSSPLKTDLKAETATYIDPHLFHGSGEVDRTAESPGQLYKSTQLHPGNNEMHCSSHEQQDLSTSQDCTIRDLPAEDKTIHVVLLTTSTSTSEEILGPFDSETQTSSRQDTSSQTPNTVDSMDMSNEIGRNCSSAKPDRIDTGCDSKCITPQCKTEVLHNLQTEPVGGGSSTSFHTHSPSSPLNCSIENNSTEENIFPPLLQINSIDMPLLTPEPEDKASISLLPPVLTQEMPSLTPAHDGIPNVSRPASCTNQIAPVLQREMPTGSLSLHTAQREDDHCDGVKPEHANSWHLALLYNCEVAAMSSSHGNTPNLTASVTHSTSGGMHDMLNKPNVAAETRHTELKYVSPEQGGAYPHQLVQDNTPQSEQDYISTKPTNTDDLDHLGSTADVLSLSSAGSLLTSASNNNPSPPPPSLGTEVVSHSALQLHHPPTYSHCTSSTTYLEPKPFSSSIWRNLNSHSPAVLIQSLNPELSSDFTSSDPLPYTIWTQPQCKEVTDLESSEHEVHLSENQEEEGRPLTWAQLEPTSLVSVGPVEPMGICGDYELQRREVEGSEALSFCTELGRKMEESEILQSGSVVSELLIGGKHHEEGSDLEEGTSDAEEAEEQCNVREEESSDLTDEEEVEEAFNHDYQCPELGLEPGEICAVSAHL